MKTMNTLFIDAFSHYIQLREVGRYAEAEEAYRMVCEILLEEHKLLDSLHADGDEADTDVVLEDLFPVKTDY